MQTGVESAALPAAAREADRQAAVSPEGLRHLDCRWLFALYALIPLSLLAVALDRFVFDGWMLARLPVNPEFWPFWTVVFGLPHIIASLLTMADREYLAYYRRVLFWPAVIFAGIAAAGLLGPQPLAFRLLFVFVAFYTVYHVMAQQFGLTLMIMGARPSRTYLAWKWCSILAAFAIYAMVYGQRELGAIYFGDTALFDLLGYAAGLLSAAVFVLGRQLARGARTRLGQWYLWGNVALVLSTYLVLEAGYLLFVVLMPRIIHDVTAYMVYVSHDTNRNRERPRNYLYRLTHFTRLPPLIVLPLVSGGIAYLLTASASIVWVNILVLTVSFLHYYFEGFIWRGNTPHRAWVSFKR